MTTIDVDPGELNATADLLRAYAAEAADIGTALWACADCPMPAQLRSLVDQLVASADRALDVSAVQLGGWANDLANRAQIAYTDALTASSITSGYSGPPAVEVGAGAGLIGGGFGTAKITIGDSTTSFGSGAALIGGGFGTANVTIGDSTTSFGSGAALIGGGLITAGVTTGDVPAGWGTNAGFLLGGSGPTFNPLRQMASTLENNPQLLAVFSHMNDVASYGINHRLSPLESDIRRNNPGMSSSYIASMFPYAGTNPYLSLKIPGL
jgi:hypothetical protein